MSTHSTAPITTHGTARPGMRFHVDGWDPTYGSSVDIDESSLEESTARIRLDVEVPADRWAPIPVTPGPEPGALLFVDGVRRTEARLWIDHVAASPIPAGPAAPALVAVDATMALCASYAAGVVCCCPDGGAHVVAANTRRGLFTTAADATDVTTTAGTYRAHVSVDDASQALPVLLSTALQSNLADLEILTANSARAELVAHGVPEGTDLMVIDGPLRRRQHLPRALGFIKSHRTRYLEADQHNVVSNLLAGQRTPVFLMSSNTYDRYSWYLRLPCELGAPWTGIVRIECAADLSAATVVGLANQSQMLLPKYASVEYKDPRAPQNLVPVAGLERHLRRLLGDVTLLQRSLKVSAARSSRSQSRW